MLRSSHQPIAPCSFLHPGAGVGLPLPEVHHPAGGICHKDHATVVEHVKRACDYGPTAVGDPAGHFVRIIHCNVYHPVGRDSHLVLLFRLGVHCPRVGILLHSHGVDDLPGFIHWMFIIGPTKQICIKRLRRLLVGGRKIDPTRRPLGV